MARRITRKSMKQDEFVEAAFDAGEWLEAHWKSVALVAAAGVVVVLLGLGWMSWRASRQAAAGDLFAEGYALFRNADPGGAASASVGEAVGLFERSADRAGGSPLGDVATFYQGLAELQAGNAVDASRRFDDVVRGTSNPVLAATATANLADALARAGEPDRAETVWRELAEAEPAYFPRDMALLGLGKLLIAQGREAEAREILQGLQDDYPEGAALSQAQALLGQYGVPQ